MLLEALKQIPGTIQIMPGQKFHEPDPEKAREWLEQGFARAPDGPNRRGWNGLRWDGAEVAILASGESMSAEQADAVLVWRTAGYDRKVIVINTTFRRAPWADVLYACDGQWWEGKDHGQTRTYLEEARVAFGGELWTQDAAAATQHKLKHVRSEPGAGLSKVPGIIKQGSNGGHQAIGLAYWAGAARCYLLGFDMRGGHWHGKHPGRLEKAQRFDIFLRAMGQLADQIKGSKEFEVINCTPGSAMKCFPTADWREVFR